MSTEAPVWVEEKDDGQIWRVTLNTPKANILDMQKTEILGATFRRARESPHLKAVILEGAGPHFSFGASVEEHQHGKFEAMLTEFHKLFRGILDASVVTLAAVRGQCLGGGLELASFCNRVIAAPDSRLGQPEIALGVFAPVASVALAERVGRGNAEDLCLSGRSLTAEEAHRIGLVDEIAADPAEAAMAYAREHLLPRSASSLRLAVRAVRDGFGRRFRAEVERTERLYCDELMKTTDAAEGLEAFLEKRQPVWRDR